MKMKKATKFLLGGALVILLFTPVSQVKADWHRDNIGWWYTFPNSTYYIRGASTEIDGKWYRFDKRGYMVTGWQLDEYTTNTGEFKRRWSYYDPVNGDYKTGWLLIDGKWYYLYGDGPRGGRQNIDGKLYYFDPVTFEMKTGWMLLDDPNPSWYYFDPVSGALPEGWKNIDGKWYYFKYSAVKGSREIDGKFYYFDPVNCDMKTGWMLLEDSNGNSSWYYYDPESGARLSGWQTIDGKTYYFGQFGKAFVGLWQLEDGKQYYFDPVNCDLKTGWLDLNGSRYYADPNDGGAFASNKTLIIDGVSYTFGSGGYVINNEP